MNNKEIELMLNLIDSYESGFVGEIPTIMGKFVEVAPEEYEIIERLIGIKMVKEYYMKDGTNYRQEKIFSTQTFKSEDNRYGIGFDNNFVNDLKELVEMYRQAKILEEMYS